MKTLRRLGLGDLEHVRNGLLCVAYFGTQRAVDVAQAAYALGDELQMMTRLHLDFSRLTERQRSDVMNIFFRNQSHQLEPWEKNTAFLRGVVVGCDIIVQDATSLPRVVETAEDVEGLDLRAVWKGRPLAGNHSRLTRSELQTRGYPIAETV